MEVSSEFGPAGGDKVDARAGDFVHVPPRAVHRESNPTEKTSAVVLFQTGSGDVVVNVEGPGRLSRAVRPSIAGESARRAQRLHFARPEGFEPPTFGLEERLSLSDPSLHLPFTPETAGS